MRLRRKAGGSTMLAVPRALLDPHPRPRYTFDELLAQCDPKAPRSKEDRAWVSGKPAGGELI